MGTNTQRQNDKTYDELPYESYVFPDTHPEHLAVIAKLFGFESPDIKTARILELGCAGGGNVFPIALNFPGTRITAIDLSPVQIDMANAQKKELGIANINFMAMDIMDITPGFGTFDYIIAHGVFSWVPAVVRDKIMNVLQQNLSPTGLGFFSYNVMPGWASYRAIRDMLIMHTENIIDLKQKAAAATAFVDFLDINMSKENHLWKAVNMVNANFKKQENDSYVLHEYLEENNNQFYFRDIAKMLQQHRLNYVGDGETVTMFSTNFSKEIDTALKTIDNPVEREQTFDFLINRQFRQTIVTPEGNVSAGKNTAIIKEFHLSTDLVAAGPVDPGAPHEAQRYNRPGTEFTITTNDDATKGILNALIARRGSTFTFDALVDIAASFRPLTPRDTLEQQQIQNIHTLITQNILQAHLTASRHCETVSARPKAYALSRYQANIQGNLSVTACTGTTFKLTLLEMCLLRHLDGTKTHEQLVDFMHRDVVSAGLKINNAHGVITDPAEQKSLIAQNIPKILKNFCQYGVMAG